MGKLLRSGETGTRQIRPRVAVASIVVVLAMGVLVVNLYHLQILRGTELAEKSKINFIKELIVPADRGIVFDRRGTQLAENRVSFDVVVTPAFCKPCDSTFSTLARVLKLDKDDLQNVRADFADAAGLERFQPLRVKQDITRDEVDLVEAAKARGDLSPAVDLVGTPHRAYRVPPGFAHAIGYESEISPDELKERSNYRRGDYIGKRGIERAFEAELRGQDGRERVVVDAKGNKLGDYYNELLIAADQRVLLSVPGHNLVLSLDARLQKIAEDTFPARAGAVVVLDPNTGFILALVSRPAYDPNKMTGRLSEAEYRALADDPLKPMIFRATQEHYHPGSTFKTAVALAALEDGAINDHSSIRCNGGYTLGNHRWRCDKETGHGALEIKRALEMSCDTFFYALGDRIGIDSIANMARELGYGRPTGLGLGHEIAGIIPDVAYHKRETPGGYTKGFALNAAIGQGAVNVTPLQQVVAYAAIANGGTIYRPQIVRRIETANGRVIHAFAPEVTGKLEVKPQTLQIVRAGLEAVVNEAGGTAYRTRLPDIRFAGKTGTAQVVTLVKRKVAVSDQSYFSRDHAWFAAYAPAQDPEIAVVVLAEHGGWGAEAAAPTASAIVHGYFELKKADDAARVAAQTPPVVSPTPPATIPPPEQPVRTFAQNPKDSLNSSWPDEGRVNREKAVIPGLDPGIHGWPGQARP